MHANAVPSPAPHLQPVRSAGKDWRLLVAGDAVTIDGAGPTAYEVIHVSHGSAWLSGLADGAQRLVDAATLHLLSAGRAPTNRVC